MKLSEVVDLNKKKKEILINISTIVGLIAVLLAAFVIVCQFAIYIYDMQWFNYWNIDSIFYIKSNTDIINGLLFGFSLICVYLLLSLALYGMSKIKEEKDDINKKIRTKDKIYFFAIFSFCYLLLGLKDLYFHDFSRERILTHFTGIVISLWLMKRNSNKIGEYLEKQRKDFIFNRTIKDILIDLLAGVVIIFVSVIIIGNITALVKNDFKIVMLEEKCNVILYSTNDYYITAKCEIYNIDKIKIYRKEQTKIDNYNVSYQSKNFSKIHRK